MPDAGDLSDMAAGSFPSKSEVLVTVFRQKGQAWEVIAPHPRSVPHLRCPHRRPCHRHDSRNETRRMPRRCRRHDRPRREDLRLRLLNCLSLPQAWRGPLYVSVPSICS